MFLVRAKHAYGEVGHVVKNGEVDWASLKQVQKRKMEEVVKEFERHAGMGHVMAMLHLGECFQVLAKVRPCARRARSLKLAVRLQRHFLQGKSTRKGRASNEIMNKRKSTTEWQRAKALQRRSTN